MSPGKNCPELQLCDRVPSFRQRRKQLQSANVVSLCVGDECIGQRVTRTRLLLVSCFGVRRERTRCCPHSDECCQQDPSLKSGVWEHGLALDCRDTLWSTPAFQKASTSKLSTRTPIRIPS